MMTAYKVTKEKILPITQAVNKKHIVIVGDDNVMLLVPTQSLSYERCYNAIDIVSGRYYTQHKIESKLEFAEMCMRDGMSLYVSDDFADIGKVISEELERIEMANIATELK